MNIRQIMNRIALRSLVALGILVVSNSVVSAGTYYIDYRTGDDANSGLSKSSPWKYAPGMSGFSGSYSHQAGDTFIFKGGVTWPFFSQWSISNSGRDGSIDTYRSDTTWYEGETFSPPVLSGPGNWIAAYKLVYITGSYIKFQDFIITGLGQEGGTSDARALAINGTTKGVELYNLQISPYTNHAIVVHFSNSINLSNCVKIHRCKISHATNSMEIFGDGGPGTIDGVEIYDNEIYDPHTQLVGGDHGDGLHFYTDANGSKLFTNLKIYRNYFHGNWQGYDASTICTAQLYIEKGCVDGALIYNNIFSFSNTSQMKDSYVFSPGFVVIAGNNVRVYNNTINATRCVTIGQHGVARGISMGSGNGNKIIGNIITGCKIGISLNSSDPITCDYNIVSPRATDGVWGEYIGAPKSLSQFQDLGFDTHSQQVDPKLADIENIPMDHSLQSNSPAIDFLPTSSAPGEFSDDINGVRRPQGIAWDIGACEYAGQAAPPPPSSLRIVKQ